jgi:hypothetical protein
MRNLRILSYLMVGLIVGTLCAYCSALVGSTGNNAHSDAVDSFVEYNHEVGVYADAEGNVAFRGDLPADSYRVGTCKIHGTSFCRDYVLGLLRMSVHDLQITSEWQVRSLDGSKEASLSRIAQTNEQSVRNFSARTGIPFRALVRALRAESGATLQRCWSFTQDEEVWMTLFAAEAAMGLIWSLAWIPKVPLVARRLRRYGVCPTCGYEVVGESRCSECGR